MLLDARRLPPHAELAADVCVVGAGAAGITLALEWIGRGLRVCVLEGGGPGLHADADGLLAAESVGLPYAIDGSRKAGLGGTTCAWAGWCRPLDEIDFEARSAHGGHGGWPFRAGDLAAFYHRAHAICGLGPFAYESEAAASRARPLLPLAPERIQTRIWRFAKRLRFGPAYAGALRGARDLQVVQHAWAVELEADESGQRVGAVRAATTAGRPLRVRARAFVLAAGGIENARLLLDSGPSRRGGLGNARGLVGCFFADHPYVDAGWLLPADPRRLPRLYLRHRTGGWRVQAVLTLADAVVRREGLLRCAVLLPAPYRAHADFGSPGVTAVRRLVTELRHGRLPGDAAKLTGRALLGSRAVCATAVRVAMGLRAGAPRLVARAFLESAPNPESRVTLSEARDRLGRRRARVEWRLTELERASLRRMLRVLDEELQRCGAGRLVPFSDAPGLEWPAGLGGGRHHMGTTRMHADPARGVVDVNARVHGLANLYVAGSSVFPSSGLANPTLTIVALSLRLADHVRAVLQRRDAA